ncbi:ATP phosphoribosyltransferase regulatory subunit [Uliginosibacterium sp. H1]|uniref:ATP phosphoribosyltransferase regulatory subunit n=1 Tax=Uliginosibacterium sp. H1 TaxID=3114757 RepID=UPI002E170D0A|nr:ATP phosphoribosyltransferase regulatory subunit [Uliginosibacterium sp. H1]
MALPRWALPEHFEDVLPFDALRVEGLRRALLDEFRLHGYQLVVPPMVEHLDSLVSGTGQDMADSTFKLADQLSGRTLGLRADITPQVTRIDAHLLNRRGVARLCYCGSVVHTLPRALTASREPIQIGAELYGHAGIEADEEILRLLARGLDIAGLSGLRIDLGHVGIFRALSRMAELDDAAEELLFDILQSKDVPALREFAADLPETVRAPLLALPSLYGGADVLVKAYEQLSAVPDVRIALDELLHLAKRLHDLPISFDLADLRGYHYHTGLVFAAYCGNSAAAVALGGRYNESGQAFGRARPATGFSLDLRDLVSASSATAPVASAILAPVAGDAGLADAVAALRADGEVIVIELPGHEGTWREAGCDRRLVLRDDAWRVEPLLGD